ncbi:hypothetical protein D9M71_743990 [compost metagenome]
MLGRNETERDTHQEGDDQCIDGKLKGGCTEGGHNLHHWTPVCNGGAEIASEELADVFEVLDQNGAVVAGVVDALGQDVRRKPASL